MLGWQFWSLGAEADSETGLECSINGSALLLSSCSREVSSSSKLSSPLWLHEDDDESSHEPDESSSDMLSLPSSLKDASLSSSLEAKLPLLSSSRLPPDSRSEESSLPESAVTLRPLLISSWCISDIVAAMAATFVAGEERDCCLWWLIVTVLTVLTVLTTSSSWLVHVLCHGRAWPCSSLLLQLSRT